jgi:hypothetical protein
VEQLDDLVDFILAERVAQVGAALEGVGLLELIQVMSWSKVM